MIEDWVDLEKKVNNTNGTLNADILLGNGFSISIDKAFDYSSLFERAFSDNCAVLQNEKKIFDEFSSRNFEFVLSKLLDSMKIAKILEQDSSHIEKKYKEISSILQKTIVKVHQNSFSISENRKKNIVDNLRKYRRIFTTNYDLIIHRSIASDHNKPKRPDINDFNQNPQKIPVTLNLASRIQRGQLSRSAHLPKHLQIADLIIRDKSNNNLGVFDKNLTEKENQVPIYYLHGAMMLFKNGEITYKYFSKDGLSIADMVKFDENLPLMITEGDHSAKLSAIYASDYLTHCYNTLKVGRENMVIIGNSLSDSDSHLAEAINYSNTKNIYFGLYNSDGDYSTSFAESEKRRLKKKFNDTINIHLFRSDTHPLMSAVE